MATNTHCIPDDLRLKGASCAGRVEFVFANALRAQCAEVLSVTNINEDPESLDYLRRPDVAFLRLQEPVVRVTPFHFDTQGTADGVKLKTYAIDPLPTDAIGGVLTARTCVSVQGTLANPSYIDPESAVVTATQCETKRGNSGAPAIDSSGAVRGILFGVLPPEAANKERFKSFETPAHFQVMSFITNSACVDLPTGVDRTGRRASEDACNRRLSAKDLVQRSMGQTNAGLEAQLQSWLPASASMFTFHVQPIQSKLGNTGLPLVTCVKSPMTWMPNDSSIPRGLENYTLTGSLVQLRYRAPIFSLKAAVDEHYRVFSQPSIIDYALVDMSFDVTELKSKGQTSLSNSMGSEGGALKPTTAKQNLKVCP